MVQAPELLHEALDWELVDWLGDCVDAVSCTSSNDLATLWNDTARNAVSILTSQLPSWVDLVCDELCPVADCAVKLDLDVKDSFGRAEPLWAAWLVVVLDDNEWDVWELFVLSWAVNNLALD